MTPMERWLEKITSSTVARLIADGLDCDANIRDAKAEVHKVGRKYVAIALGRSIRYFVSRESGTIYASAGRDKPNFNRSFGTLETIDDFDWSDYEATALPGTPWLMVKTSGPYFTAVPI